MSVLFVPDGLEGQRIDAAAARMTGLSRSRVVDLIGEGKVLLDGSTVVKASERVHGGQTIDID
ncbi:MAG: RNA pseudouridine synthase, partial [Propionibacterium sp.]|nr:RNA pseudouridine synthase [Propionibacterium sp.]